MERVKGIGGVFLRAKDRQKLLAWYREHLGIELEDWGGTVFKWQQAAPAGAGSTTWSVFADDTEYFGPRSNAFMINYRVDDLDRMLDQLRAAGVEVDERVEDSEYGRFGWAVDLDGNRLELWQPPDGM